MKMTKSDLVNVISAETELKKKDVDTVVNAVFDKIVAAMKDGEKVQLIGFGTFEVKATAARTAMNPQTKEPVQVPASKKPAFTASKAFKDAIIG